MKEIAMARLQRQILIRDYCKDGNSVTQECLQDVSLRKSNSFKGYGKDYKQSVCAASRRRRMRGGP